MPAKKKAKTTKKKTAAKKTAKKVAKKAVKKSAPKKAAAKKATKKKTVPKKPLKESKPKLVIEKEIVVPPHPEPAPPPPPPPPPKKKLGIDCDHCDATGICAAGNPYDRSHGQTFGAKVRMTSCVECLEEAGEHKNSKKLVKCRLCDGDGKI